MTTYLRLRTISKVSLEVLPSQAAPLLQCKTDQKQKTFERVSEKIFYASKGTTSPTI